jgi:Kdo2-lipid IVA lauroyltransferase/acyltransferase
MYLMKLISRIPLFVLYGIADFVSFIAMHVVGYRKKMVLANLRHAFPEKSEKELKQIAAGFYKNLADVAVETLKLLTISKKELQKRVKIIDFHLLDNPVKSGQPVIIMTSHQSNWEWMLQGTYVHADFEIDAVYRPLTSNFADKLMLAIRTRFGVNAITDRQVVREVARRRNIPRLVALVADQRPQFGDNSYWAPFLNREAPFFRGGEKIAKATGYPIVFSQMVRVKRGFYELRLHQLASPPYEQEGVQILDSYIAMVEKAIREYPSDWLWSHNRWKYQPVAATAEATSTV